MGWMDAQYVCLSVRSALFVFLRPQTLIHLFCSVKVLLSFLFSLSQLLSLSTSLSALHSLTLSTSTNTAHASTIHHSHLHYIQTLPHLEPVFESIITTIFLSFFPSFLCSTSRTTILCKQRKHIQRSLFKSQQGKIFSKEKALSSIKHIQKGGSLSPTVPLSFCFCRHKESSAEQRDRKILTEAGMAWPGISKCLFLGHNLPLLRLIESPNGVNGLC